MQADIARIFDANLNRAREGLRVLEEYVRFVLEDAGLAKRIKELRHEVARLANRLPANLLLSARDTPGDVGTTITTTHEMVRRDSIEVARAACKRVTEAIRCIEEYAKVFDAAASTAAERLRYEIYSLEQAIFLCSPRRKKLIECRLHVLMTESLCHLPWRQVCDAALRGGAGILQLREKSLSDRELLQRARELRELTLAHDALLIINDRPDIACLSGADGLHVGQSDLSIQDARQIVGPHVLIGLSTHSVEQLVTAIDEKPDYIAVGPMFDSKTKPGNDPKGPQLLHDALVLIQERADPSPMPIVAIGGITAERVSQLSDVCSSLVQSGGAEPILHLAVCQAIIGADDPAAACREIIQNICEKR